MASQYLEITGYVNAEWFLWEKQKGVFTPGLGAIFPVVEENQKGELCCATQTDNRFWVNMGKIPLSGAVKLIAE